jgi:hypothetical protein
MKVGFSTSSTCPSGSSVFLQV